MTAPHAPRLPKTLVAMALGLGLLASAPRAHAQDAPARDPDTVVLRDGSRLRGSVIEEDPKKGVTVRMLDGTTRKVPKKSVDHIEYAPDPEPAPAAPVVVAPPPAPAQPAAVYVMPDPAPPKAGPRSKGLLVMGLIFMPIGAIAIGAGVPYYMSSSQSHTVHYQAGCDSNGICGTGSETFNDRDGQTISAAMMVGGGVFLVTGLIFTIVGAHRHAPADEAWTSARTPKLALGAPGSGAYLAPNAHGLTLHF